jgi:hypothetical protein
VFVTREWCLLKALRERIDEISYVDYMQIDTTPIPVLKIEAKDPKTIFKQFACFVSTYAS